MDGRTSRADLTAEHRRRRQPGSLNRMVTSNLGIDPSLLDPEYHYHWANDEKGRLRSLTVHDDYEFVSASELGDGFDRSMLKAGESEERVSVVVEGRGRRRFGPTS